MCRVATIQAVLLQLMKIYKYFCVLMLCCIAGAANASHIIGADFYYTHITGLTYQITLVLYGDCATKFTPNGSYNNLPGSSPEVKIIDGTVFSTTIDLGIQAPAAGVDVTPVCPAYATQTTCFSPTATIPGITKFVYSGTYTLPHESANWLFQFTGNLGSNGQAGLQAGRSNGITNIVFTGNSSVMVLQAELNNATPSGYNNSPTFTSLPTPFYCINIPQEYNQGSVDPDGDSLVFNLANALQQQNMNSATVVPVTYQFGYSATHPLSAAAGTFSYNSLNGQLGFTPDNVQTSLVLNKVTEYRAGVKVGSAMREMNFIVLGTCNNTPPSGDIDSPSTVGGSAVAGDANTIYACPGSPDISFHIYPHDPDGVVYVSLAGVPSGATATITGDSTDTPDIFFFWNTASLSVGNYTFYVTYRDDGCPLSSAQTEAYTIRITDPPLISAAQLGRTDCQHKALVQYTASLGSIPRTITVAQNGIALHTVTDTSGTALDSLAAGDYTITVTSAGLNCASQVAFVVVDSGRYPYPPLLTSPVQYCKGDSASQLTMQAAGGGSIQWYSATHQLLPNAPTPNTAVDGNTVFYVAQTVGVCSQSPTDSVLVQVTTRPTATFTAAPSQVCARSPVTLQFTGTTTNIANVVFNWQTDGADSTIGTGEGPLTVIWDTAGQKTITLQVTENGCPSLPYQQQVLVKPTPVSLFTVSNPCQYDPVTVTYDALPLDDQQYAWSFPGTSMVTSNGDGPFNLSYAQAGFDTLTLITSLNGCADTFSKAIEVYPKPQVETPIKEDTACFGDVVYLSATGADTYQWLPADKVYTSPSTGQLFIRVTEPSTYTVIGTTIHGCTDTATVTYTDVIACCTFSFPDAFTPNGDGKNDGYSPIIYGNQLWYNFSIYNRWGQCVFHSQDPSQQWNGTVGGKPCDVDTYYYQMKAKCLTGKEIEQNGDFILIR